MWFSRRQIRGACDSGLSGSVGLRLIIKGEREVKVKLTESANVDGFVGVMEHSGLKLSRPGCKQGNCDSKCVVPEDAYHKGIFSSRVFIFLFTF